MTPLQIIALQNEPLAYYSLWMLDSIYKMTPRPIIDLQNDQPAYNSLAKWPPYDSLWLLDLIYKMAPKPTIACFGLTLLSLRLLLNYYACASYYEDY